MNKSLKLKCIVTGKGSFFSGEYLSKKINDYDNIESLKKYYICREVKALLNKGYKIADIRNTLNVSDDIEELDQDTINTIETKFKKVNLKIPTINENLTGFTYNKSDKDVESFINEYIIKT